jgi:hypothetical protein
MRAITSSAAVERTAAAVAIAIARRICGRTGLMMRQGEGALGWDMGFSQYNRRTSG